METVTGVRVEMGAAPLLGCAVLGSVSCLELMALLISLTSLLMYLPT